MNSRTVALAELAANIAQATGADEQEVSGFIVALFAGVQEALASGHSASIDGIGTFKAVDGNVEFTPDEAFASEVNAPFSMFSPVELPDDTPDDFFESGDPDETTPAEAPLPADEPVPEEEPQPEEASAEEPEEEEEPEAEEMPEETEQEEPTVDYEPTDYADERPSRALPWLTAAAGLLAGLLAGYIIGSRYATHPLPAQRDSSLIQEAPAAADSVIVREIPVDTDTAIAAQVDAVAPADTVEQPAPAEKETAAPVYDTVTPTRFLTTMARDHYGRKDYWVFIYEANSNILRHPNRIRPGTRVVIPDLGERAALDPEMRARAHKLANEIYSRYDL